MDPREPILNFKYEELEPDFGTQYADFVHETDNILPEPKMKELPVIIFVDLDHGHNKVTGRSVTGIVVLVVRTPIYCEDMMV